MNKRYGRHGLSKTKIYSAWHTMVKRCHNPQQPGYESYGERGIKVCDRWRVFANFYADMGPRPEGMTLERIDNDKDYEPENCRWATPKEQGRNRRTNLIVTAFGISAPLASWIGATKRSKPNEYQRAFTRAKKGADMEALFFESGLTIAWG